MPRDAHFSIRLSRGEKEALDRLASEQQVPVGQLVRRLLAPHLNPAASPAIRRVPEEPAADPLRLSEQAWLRANAQLVSQMAGEWVVLEGDNLVAHGPDYAMVRQQARQSGIRIPFILRIPESRPPNSFYVGL